MRSGNTFAAAAFSITNPDAGHVGRHIHTPAHVLQAVHLQIPTLVLVRDPRAVAVSHVIRRPALTVSDSLIDYSLFFETIEPVRDHLVAVSFEDLIEHFDSVIARLNDAFDTSFRAQSVTDEFLAAVTRRVEEMNRQESVSRGEVDERRVARPSASREALRAEPERQLESTENRRSLARAVAAYQRWRV